jgi:hypothetical protein
MQDAAYGGGSLADSDVGRLPGLKNLHALPLNLHPCAHSAATIDRPDPEPRACLASPEMRYGRNPLFASLIRRP